MVVTAGHAAVAAVSPGFNALIPSTTGWPEQMVAAEVTQQLTTVCGLVRLSFEPRRGRLSG
jgi:hypothetical protein